MLLTLEERPEGRFFASYPGPLPPNQRADTGVSEQFHQHRVLNPPIDDMRRFYPGAHRIQRAGDFRQHPAVNRALQRRPMKAELSEYFEQRLFKLFRDFQEKESVSGIAVIFTALVDDP